jgi:hypothetical protein
MGVRSSNDMILLGRWVGNTECPAALSMKGGHPSYRWPDELAMYTNK